jgi:hypothetical protein
MAASDAATKRQGVQLGLFANIRLRKLVKTLISTPATILLQDCVMNRDGAATWTESPWCPCPLNRLPSPR